ncbi:MAG: hypothetical protein AB8F34_12460 [Akkermansiaceae bacterium]
MALCALAPLMISEADAASGELRKSNKLLKIAAFQLTDPVENAKGMISMDEKGRLFRHDDKGKKVEFGKVSANGILQSSDGKDAGKLKHNGEMVNPEGRRLGILKADGTVVALDGQKWIWDEGGVLKVPGERNKLKVVPNNADTRRIASIFLCLWFTPLPVE